MRLPGAKRRTGAHGAARPGERRDPRCRSRPSRKRRTRSSPPTPTSCRGRRRPMPFAGVLDGNLSANVLVEHKWAAMVHSTATNTPPHAPVRRTSRRATAARSSMGARRGAHQLAPRGAARRPREDVQRSRGSARGERRGDEHGDRGRVIAWSKRWKRTTKRRSRALRPGNFPPVSAAGATRTGPPDRQRRRPPRRGGRRPLRRRRRDGRRPPPAAAVARMTLDAVREIFLGPWSATPAAERSPDAGGRCAYPSGSRRLRGGSTLPAGGERRRPDPPSWGWSTVAPPWWSRAWATAGSISSGPGVTIGRPAHERRHDSGGSPRPRPAPTRRRSGCRGRTRSRRSWEGRASSRPCPGAAGGNRETWRSLCTDGVSDHVDEEGPRGAACGGRRPRGKKPGPRHRVPGPWRRAARTMRPRLSCGNRADHGLSTRHERPLRVAAQHSSVAPKPWSVAPRPVRCASRPVATRVAPGSLHVTPRATRVASVTFPIAPCATRVASGTRRHGLGTRPDPGSLCVVSGPRTTRTAPETTRTAPETTCTAPETTRTAPETTQTAPETTRTAPETTRTAPEERRVPRPRRRRPRPKRRVSCPERRAESTPISGSGKGYLSPSFTRA